MKVVKVGALWCSSCIIVNKYWGDLVCEFPNIEFAEYDLDFDEDFVKDLSIGNKLPEIIFFQDNKEVFRMVGEKSKEEVLRELLRIYV